METPQPPWANFLSLITCTVTSPMFKWNFLYFKVCLLFLVLPLSITEKHLIPLLLLIRDLQPLVQMPQSLYGPSLDPLQYIHASLLLGCPELVPALLNCATSAEQRAGSLPSPADSTAPRSPGGIGCKGALLACVNVHTSHVMYPSTTLPISYVQPICT